MQGGFVLAKGKQEVKAPVQGEATVHQKAVAGMSRVEEVQQEVVLQSAGANKTVTKQEAPQQPDSMLKGGGKSRNGVTRSHAQPTEQMGGDGTSRGVCVCVCVFLASGYD